jgi:hypothetical protein
MSAFIHKVLNPFLSLPTPHQKEASLHTHNPPQASTSTPATLTPQGVTSGAIQPITAVIELFQSQGCSSCPPANDFLVSRAPDPNELLLTYEVTYWDYLGWTDTFGDSRWDARQTAYARALRQRSCYTPQVIVDGGARAMGSSWRDLGNVLASGTLNGGRMRFEAVDGGKDVRIVREEGKWNGGGKALVLVVEFEAEPKPVKILRGENRGVTEQYRNVVRDLQVVATWEGGDCVVELPERRRGLEMAVLVQAGDGGHILGAARV